jgi:thiol-disulfide isomerase/thioredoxin
MKLLKFEADWCHSCDEQDALLAEYYATPVEHIDVDEEIDRANKYSVRSLPTLVLLDEEGNPRWRSTGVTQLTEIRQEVAALEK